ncbi:MAG: hypothetical protein ACAI25_07370 [Planctomycetota bacterium]
MSTTRTFAAGLLALAALVPATARAQSGDPCDINRLIDVKVPLFRPANEVQGYNKIRLSMLPVRDEANGTLTVEVRGTAYYPDDVVLVVGIRHAKVKEHFKKETKVVVKDRTFSCRFGPFKKVIPGGGLAVDAAFLMQSQSEKVKEQLVKEKWFHCSPPCTNDLASVGHIIWSNGGFEAQAEAEKAEKEQMAAVRDQLLAASKACDAVIGQIAAKQADPTVAAAALQKLDGDLKAAADGYNNWRTTREFPLFNSKVASLRSLSSHIRELQRAAAADAGATVPDMEPGKVKDQLSHEKKEVQRIGDEIKGFLGENDSLDRLWNALGKQLSDRYLEKCDAAAQPPKK